MRARVSYAFVELRKSLAAAEECRKLKRKKKKEYDLDVIRCTVPKYCIWSAKRSGFHHSRRKSEADFSSSANTITSRDFSTSYKRQISYKIIEKYEFPLNMLIKNISR